MSFHTYLKSYDLSEITKIFHKGTDTTDTTDTSNCRSKALKPSDPPSVFHELLQYPLLLLLTLYGGPPHIGDQIRSAETKDLTHT